VAETLAVIESRQRADFPFPQYDTIGGERVAKTQEQYDQWIANQAIGIRDQQLADDADAAWQTTVDQFVAGRANLQSDLTLVNNRITANTSLTAAEIRIGFRDLLQSMIWIADRIQDGTLVTRKP